MFELPSIWNIVISTVVFFIAAWYLRRFLDEQGIPAGFTRGVVVFICAYFISWASGELVDYVQEKIEGPKPSAQTSEDLSSLLKELKQVKL